jgi:hypothetical protein
VQLRGKYSQSERRNSSNSVPICVFIFLPSRTKTWTSVKNRTVFTRCCYCPWFFVTFSCLRFGRPAWAHFLKHRATKTCTYTPEWGSFFFRDFHRKYSGHIAGFLKSIVKQEEKVLFSLCVQLYAKKAWSNLGRVGSSWFYVFCETLWESLSRTSNVYTVETRALDLYTLASCSSSSSSPAGPGLARRGLIFMF